MKILKALFALVGVVGLAVAGYYLFNSWIATRELLAAANSGRSQALSPSPWAKIVTTALLFGAGGLLLGLGIGLPMRTPGSIRKEALQDAADARELQIRDRAAARGESKEG